MCGDLLDRAQVRGLVGDAAQVGRRAETDDGLRSGLTSDERERVKTLEAEKCELRRANEIFDCLVTSGTSWPLAGRPATACG